MLYREIPFSPPDITEEEINSVAEALRSGWITTGPKTKEFEKKISEYLGVNRTVCLNSATAGMEMVLRVMGIGPGDEVITSAYTYTASAAVIEHVGAKIVLVDTQVDSVEMDYKNLEEAITENTKLIIPVDIAGRICDYEKIFKIVDRQKHKFSPNNSLQEAFNRIVVMADAAHSFGASYQGMKSGQIADFSCFSFHAVKNLTTSEGGAVVWRNNEIINDEDLYKKFMIYSLHGQTKDALEKNKVGSWEYDIVVPGYKCNMTDIVASIGLIQLERFESFLIRRKEIIEQYNNLFKKSKISFFNHFDEKSNSSGHLYLTRIDNASAEQRNLIVNKMGEAGIAVNVHYKPLPLLTAYKNLGFDISNYPNSFSLYQNEITLPLHTKLSDDDVRYIAMNYQRIVSDVMSSETIKMDE